MSGTARIEYAGHWWPIIEGQASAKPTPGILSMEGDDTFLSLIDTQPLAGLSDEKWTSSVVHGEIGTDSITLWDCYVVQSSRDLLDLHATPRVLRLRANDVVWGSHVASRDNFLVSTVWVQTLALDDFLHEWAHPGESGDSITLRTESFPMPNDGFTLALTTNRSEATHVVDWENRSRNVNAARFTFEQPLPFSEALRKGPERLAWLCSIARRRSSPYTSIQVITPDSSEAIRIVCPTASPDEVRRPWKNILRAVHLTKPETQLQKWWALCEATPTGIGLLARLTDRTTLAPPESAFRAAAALESIAPHLVGHDVRTNAEGVRLASMIRECLTAPDVDLATSLGIFSNLERPRLRPLAKALHRSLPSSIRDKLSWSEHEWADRLVQLRNAFAHASDEVERLDAEELLALRDMTQMILVASLLSELGINLKGNTNLFSTFPFLPRFGTP